MHKKNQTVITQITTPKSTSKNVRTLSQNSSSGSSKSKLPMIKINQIDKQNLSENIQEGINAQKNVQNNNFKGLKRIKEKATGQSKVVTQKLVSKPFEIQKLPYKNLQKTSSQSHSNKSLLISNRTKGQANQTDKKSALHSQRHTPKSIPKRSGVIQKKHDKKLSDVSNTQTVITETIINDCQQNQNFQTQSEHLKTQAIQDINIKSQNENSAKNKNEKSNKKILMISMFQIRNKLTESAFSTTFQVIHIQTGFLFCLKVFQKRKIKQQNLVEQIVAEIQFRRSVFQQNMQKLFTVFDDQVYLYFVEEYIVGFGTIQKEMQVRRRLAEKQSAIVFKQVLQTIKSIHSQNFIHRDIRLENIAKCFGVIKIVDFSWVACLRYKKQRDTFCGTYKSAPPQLLQGENYDQSIDIWSLGILLYELTTGQSPFTDPHTQRNSHSMNFPIFLSNELVDLIGRLLSPKGVRMRVEQIMMHEWTNKWELDGFVAKQIWDFWVL